jgi:hypothetical protein
VGLALDEWPKEEARDLSIGSMRLSFFNQEQQGGLRQTIFSIEFRRPRIDKLVLDNI